MWNYVPKLDVLLLSNSFTHCFFTYITSATSSDEMELWSSLDNSFHFQTLNFFFISIFSSVVQEEKKQCLFFMPSLTNC